jgi:hypothetical protein
MEQAQAGTARWMPPSSVTQETSSCWARATYWASYALRRLQIAHLMVAAPSGVISRGPYEATAAS